MTNDLTLVTALFNLGRGDANQGLADYQRRPFEEYLASFDVVLGLDAPLCIYLPPELEVYVWQRRCRSNTQVIVHPLEALRERFAFFAQVERIRLDPAWRTRAAWLAESPQANLTYYNPLVMSKMFMLNDQQLTNPFSTDHFLWIDAGLARTCGAYLGPKDCLTRVASTLERFLFICFPYIGGAEVHGYDRVELARLAGTDYIRRVARGGLFGGSRESIGKANAMYWHLLEMSLAQGEMGTEESIFSAMSYLEPALFDRFEIAENGLIGPFFEALQRGAVPLVRSRLVQPGAAPSIAAEPDTKRIAVLGTSGRARDVDALSTAFYILTFNLPKQLEMLVESWRQQSFFDRATVYVIDNSTDPVAIDVNRAFCAKEGFQHLAQGNIGICGGRQLAAELFEASVHDYMFFLEDDMLLASRDMGPCRAGFVRWVDGLHRKLLGLMEWEKFDFLKLSFSEVYGNNSEQWAWYNVPSDVRRRLWPDQPELPKFGFAPRIPSINFERLGVFEGLPYAAGEVYYSNWPQVVGREGNRRMFLNTKWAHPHEQTWMSYHFQEVRAGRLRPAVLLASLIDHRRDFHYGRNERIES
jgi:Bacterial protein of unknown function (HtrL_YibB)